MKNIIPEGFAERLIADGLRSVEDALAQQIGAGIELTGRRKDGSDFPIEIMLSPLTSAEGILVTAAIRDISVRKDAEKHLVKTMRELARANRKLVTEIAERRQVEAELSSSHAEAELLLSSISSILIGVDDHGRRYLGITQWFKEHRQTSEIDILDRLELDGWTSLIGFDAEAARERISGLPWIEVAAVRKVYPHTLEVRVEEREAFALWQQGNDLSVIEKNGAVIAPFSGGKQVLLPLLIGDGAPARAPDFLAKIAKYPDLASRVKGYIRVGDRRWDLRLDNGITVKLPEDDEDQALTELVKMVKADPDLLRHYTLSE